MKKPEGVSPKITRGDPRASYNRVSIALLPNDAENVRAVTGALRELHITHPRMLASVITFLKRRPPDEHVASTASFKGNGGKEVLEVRAYQGHLYLQAPPPAHLAAHNEREPKIDRGLARTDLRVRIEMEVPDVHEQLKQLNEHVGIYNYAIPRSEKIILRTRDGDSIRVSPYDLERLGLLVKLPRRGAATTKSKSTRVAPVRNKKLLVQNANVLIDVLQQVVDYKRRRGDNRPPPDLWIDDSVYLDAVHLLIVELRRLIDTVKKDGSTAVRVRTSIDLKQSAQKFFDSYGDFLGKWAAGMTMAALTASTLYLAGFSPESVSKFYKIFK